MDIAIEPGIETSPTPKDALHDWFDRADGPTVLGFRVSASSGLEHEIDWHRHVRAQLICVESGLVTARTQGGNWSLPPGCAGWLPPGEPHAVQISGQMRGWGLLVAPTACAGLPAAPCVVGISELLRNLAIRVVDWPAEQAHAPRQQRLGDVLLDELRDAPAQDLHLPMPRDRRLLRIAQRLLAEPADGNSLAHWASWGGLSARSLSRHFRDQTGMSFAQWRQQARLAESLRLLHEGEPIGGIADRLGYSSPSAFITVFRRHYGAPPGRYLHRSLPGPADPGLASPAASG